MSFQSGANKIFSGNRLFDGQGINSPIMGLAAGLLAARGPGGTFGGGLSQGLLNMNQMRNANTRDQLLQAKLAENQRMQEQEEARREAFGQYLGQPQQQTPFQADTFPGEAPMGGLLSESPATGLYEANPQMAQVMGLLGPEKGAEVLANLAMREGPKAPSDIQTLSYLMQNPEMMDAYTQMKRAGAASTNVNVGMDKPLSIGDLQKLRDAEGNMPPVGTTAGQAAQGGFKAVDPKTPEAAAKEQMLSTAQAGIPSIEGYLFDDKGNIDRTNLTTMSLGGIPGTEGQTLGVLFETGIQAITRGETGAAMPPSEVENTRKRFQPSALDSDATVKVKFEMYKDFINKSLKLINPDATFNDEKFNKELERRLGETTKQRGRNKRRAATGGIQFMGFE